MNGVVRTRAGYAGGTKENPTYHDLGDHSETIQIDYDPELVSYKDLFDVFWNMIDPYAENWSTQYASILFYHDEEQKSIFEEARKEAEKSGKTVKVEAKPYTMLYLAENYHQKYYLQNNTFLMKDYKEMYSTYKDFIDSTSAARVNGYIKGYGSIIQLQSEINDLGLSEKGKSILLDIVQGYQG